VIGVASGGDKVVRSSTGAVGSFPNGRLSKWSLGRSRPKPGEVLPVRLASSDETKGLPLLVAGVEILPVKEEKREEN